MTSKLLAAAVALSSSIALHAVPALADDGQRVTELLENASSGRVYFPAQQGMDYMLTAFGDGTVSIINPASVPSLILSPRDSSYAEAQFRAAYTASYGLDVQTSSYAS